jgi:hypothetical protein
VSVLLSKGSQRRGRKLTRFLSWMQWDKLGAAGTSDFGDGMQRCGRLEVRVC